MDLLDDILADWRACRPDGAVLRAERLPELLERTAERVACSEAPRAAQHRAYRLLQAPSRGQGSKKGGDPRFLKQLGVDAAYRFGGRGFDAGGEGTAVAYFVRFWQAMELVWQQAGTSDADAEPLAAEASAFREALLSHCKAGRLTGPRLLAELRYARKLSSDEAAWAPLEAVAEQAFALPFGSGSRRQPASSLEQPLPLDVLSAILLVWLQELTEDYRRGERMRKVQAVRDVLQCSRRSACEHLGASGWDIEAALRRHYVGGPVLVALEACNARGSWSSQSAKLRCDELQCPICVADFCPGALPVVTRCCFQVVCVHCVDALATEEGELRCPFCRRLEVRPVAGGGSAARRDLEPPEGFFEGMLRAAAKCAEQAGRMASDIATVLHPDDRPSPHDLRLDVVLGFRV